MKTLCGGVYRILQVQSEHDPFSGLHCTNEILARVYILGPVSHKAIYRQPVPSNRHEEKTVITTTFGKESSRVGPIIGFI